MKIQIIWLFSSVSLKVLLYISMEYILSSVQETNREIRSVSVTYD
jgi:hypothetical protein